jgi:GT2 family glycosyltransferase
MVCRRTAFEAIGGFDEQLFLYYEDSDLCLRLFRNGWHAYLVPAATAIHLGGASFGGDVRRQLRFFRASQDYYFRKHRPAWELVLLRGLRVLYDLFGVRTVLYPMNPGQPPS